MTTVFEVLLICDSLGKRVYVQLGGARVSVCQIPFFFTPNEGPVTP